MGVREEAAEATRLPTTPTRHRTVKDFVAVAVKLMLYTDAMTRWSRLMNWCKLVKGDAGIATAPSHDVHFESTCMWKQVCKNAPSHA